MSSNTTNQPKLDLLKVKQRESQLLDIKKDIGLDGLLSRVMGAFDYSGSMRTNYSSGKMQEFTERVLPLGLAFDDNKEVDAFIFDDGFQALHQPITLSNAATYIEDNIFSRENGPRYEMGSTKYAPIINAIVETCGGRAAKSKKGFLGGLFKKHDEPTRITFKYPTFVLFMTDGANDSDDHEPAEEAIRNASNYGIFFSFIGIGGSSFPFLEKLDTLSGRLIDNASFFKMPTLTSTTDTELYKLLLKEYPQWVKLAKQHQLIN